MFVINLLFRNLFKLCLVLFIIFIFTACQQVDSQVTKVTQKEIISLKIGNYFPTDELIKTYFNYGTEEESGWFSEEYVKKIDELGNFIVYSDDELAGEGFKEYAVKDDSVTLVSISNIILNKETHELQLTNKTKWNVNDVDNSTRYITAIDQNIHVEGGLFENCLEVTNVTKMKDKSLIKKEYYAPKTGLIKTIIMLDDEEFVFRELYGVKGTSQNADENKQKIKIHDEVPINDSTPNGKIVNTVYRNEDLNFTIEFPNSWLDFLEVDYFGNEDHLLGSVHFYYVPYEHIRQPIITILVHHGIVDMEYFESGGHERFLGFNNGNTYSYQHPGEAVDALLNPKYHAELKQSQKMVYDESPEVMGSFSFIDVFLDQKEQFRAPNVIDLLLGKNIRTSKMSINEYMIRVNPHTTASGGVLLHRPYYEERKNMGIYGFHLLANNNDLFIVTDMEGYIKQIYWDADVGEGFHELTEILEWLLVPLANDGLLDEVVDFIAYGGGTIQLSEDLKAQLLYKDDGLELNVTAK